MKICKRSWKWKHPASKNSIMYQTQKSSNLKSMKILTCYFFLRVDGKVYFIDYDFGRDGVKDLG